MPTNTPCTATNSPGTTSRATLAAPSVTPSQGAAATTVAGPVQWVALTSTAAVTLVGLFPTDPMGTEVSSVSAGVHRVSAAWGVIVVPIARLLVARCTAVSAAGPARHGWCCWPRRSAGSPPDSSLVHLPLALVGSRIPAFGLLERAGFALVIGSLVLMALAIRCRVGAGSRLQTT